MLLERHPFCNSSRKSASNARLRVVERDQVGLIYRDEDLYAREPEHIVVRLRYIAAHICIEHTSRDTATAERDNAFRNVDHRREDEHRQRWPPHE